MNPHHANISKFLRHFCIRTKVGSNEAAQTYSLFFTRRTTFRGKVYLFDRGGTAQVAPLVPEMGPGQEIRWRAAPAAERCSLPSCKSDTCPWLPPLRRVAYPCQSWTTPGATPLSWGCRLERVDALGRQNPLHTQWHPSPHRSCYPSAPDRAARHDSIHLPAASDPPPRTSPLQQVEEVDDAPREPSWLLRVSILVPLLHLQSPPWAKATRCI